MLLLIGANILYVFAATTAVNAGTAANTVDNAVIDATGVAATATIINTAKCQEHSYCTANPRDLDSFSI